MSGVAYNLLAVAPAVAAGTTPVPTGITAVGPSMFLFTIAAAVVLTLLFRASARHLARFAGERSGRARLRRQLTASGREVLEDFLVPGAYGGLARIDFAVLTTGGLLCIRGIHWSGTVMGSDTEPQWTIVKGTRRQRFLNPLIQNEGRARALRKALPDVPIANLVVFTGDVEFPSSPPAGVIPLARLESYFVKHVFGPSRITDWDSVWLSLNAAVLNDADTRKDFAAQISFG
jgi:hypothetical protein